MNGESRPRVRSETERYTGIVNVLDVSVEQTSQQFGYASAI